MSSSPLALFPAAVTAAAVGVAGTAAPAVTAIGPLRRRLAPGLAGEVPGDHIALTFDDGPEPGSTPAFLDLLGEHGCRATFFVLGVQALAHPGLVRRIADEGHELALHGWAHRCVLAIPPGRLTAQLRETRRVVEEIGGTRVTRYRPPYGVLSGEALLACHTLNLTPTLWTAWGREWVASANPGNIVATVLRTLHPGGTLLLHDTDLHAPRADWRRTLEATSLLLRGPLSEVDTGPLREHRPTGTTPARDML